MTEAVKRPEDHMEMARLRDELEQMRTALEAAHDDVARLAEDRDRLLVRVTTQARELQAADAAYRRAVLGHPSPSPSGLDPAHKSETDEELRVAFEELQVLTEELEVANNSLHEANRILDKRVEQRTRELERKNSALAKSELRFRTLVEGMPQLVWRSARGGNWTWSSPQWTAYTGMAPTESRGFGWLAAFHPDDRASVQEAWNRAAAGHPLECQARIFHFGEGRYRYHRTRAAPVRTDAGEVLEWLGTSTDVDDLLTLQEQQSVLLAELQHRTRNLMGIVQSILKRTLQGSRSMEDFNEKISERMGALARVQSLLSGRGKGRRVAFDTLLREEIAAHVPLDADGRGSQVAIEGPSGVWLYSSTVQTLALAVHELMTNAVKYGAFSTPDGRLDVTWHVKETPAGKRRLRIEWRESGVRNMPDPAAPARGSGYGRELIERALPYQLRAETTYVLGKDGVHCSIEVEVAGA
jgi:PAS domain S-box-containing protein